MEASQVVYLTLVRPKRQAIFHTLKRAMGYILLSESVTKHDDVFTLHCCTFCPFPKSSTKLSMRHLGVVQNHGVWSRDKHHHRHLSLSFVQFWRSSWGFFVAVDNIVLCCHNDPSIPPKLNPCLHILSRRMVLGKPDKDKRTLLPSFPGGD
ncbi:unnamed protein product [Citrullus colocynthis]|uniref:Uncharacterized protein n=1 Tax=Citrullus colocynthis TaxID=252529 RepID=A0ABP0YK96_9ROSI